MEPIDINDAITSLNEFLIPRHPSLVLQFITSAMVKWTHFEKQRTFGQFDRRLAWQKFLSLLRKKLDERLSLISLQAHSNARKNQRVLGISQETFEKKEKEVLTLLESMSPEEVIGFIADITTNWCFAIPKNFLHLLPITLHDKKSEEAIANVIYQFFVEYIDLWP